jgi:hypothetical protein
MTAIELEIGHRLSREEAVSKLESLLLSNGNRDLLFQGVDFSRQEENFVFSGRVKGVKISGRMRVREQAVDVHVDLPWTAVAFKGTASQRIREYLEANLS